MTNQLDNSDQNRADQNWSELLAGYALDNLADDEVMSLQTYLAAHPEALLQEVNQLQNTLTLLPLGLPDVAPPAPLKAQILAAAQQTPQERINPVAIVNPAEIPANSATPVTAIDRPSDQPSAAQQSTIPQLQPSFASESTRQRPSRSPRNWWPIVGGIAAATIAAFGVQSYRMQQEIAATHQELAQLRQTLTTQQGEQSRYQQTVTLMEQAPGRLLSLAGTGFASGTTGSIIVSPSQKRAVLMVKKMPPPPPGKVYHLWAMLGGRKVSCIQFTPEADGQVLLQLPADRWSNAGGVVITIEPNQTEAQPSGDMIMSSKEI